MGNSIRTTSNIQTTTLANQAINSLDNVLSIVQTNQRDVIDTLGVTAYACKEVAK